MELLSAWIDGLLQLFVWPTFGFMLLGMVIGYVVGVLPGVGGVPALALMIPLTFTMDPINAFALLLSMATVAANTSDITSILIGVPGDGASAALVLDGYPMAKKGLAGRALSANLVASLVGAAVGAFAILAAVPIVRPLVLSLGSPEFFMLIILGMTFVAALSAGSVLKGLVAGAFGLLIALVGFDPQNGVHRFTFGSLHLWGGLGLVPVALGLFAIPEVAFMAVKRSSIASKPVVGNEGVRDGLRDVWQHRWLAVRCSLIGTFAGIIPGLGSSVAQWLAYGHAVQSSPNSEEEFGKGAVEGALGPGAANNSGLGGSLIPTLAFGIPGGLVSALLLGAFLIHGIVPGPSMLTVNLDLTMNFLWLIIVPNIITVLVSLPFLRHIAKLTAVRSSLMVPVIIVLLLVGAFASANVYLDIAVMVLFGFVGIAMVVFSWPRPALILGLVLGGLAERYLFISLQRYGWSFFGRPGVLLIAAITVGMLLVPVLKERRGRRVGAPPLPTGGVGAVPVGTASRRVGLADERGHRGSVSTVPEEEAPELPRGLSRPSRLKRRGDLALGGGFFAVGALALWHSRHWPFGAGVLVWGVSSIIAALSLAYLVWQTTRTPTADEGSSSGVDMSELDARTIGKRGSALFAWFAIAWAGVYAIGFVYTAVSLCLAYTLAAREKLQVVVPYVVVVGAVLLSLQIFLDMPLTSRSRFF